MAAHFPRLKHRIESSNLVHLNRRQIEILGDMAAYLDTAIVGRQYAGDIDCFQCCHDLLKCLFGVIKVDCNSLGNLGHQRVFTVGYHHDRHAEIVCGAYVGGDSITGRGCDQKNKAWFGARLCGGLFHCYRCLAVAATASRTAAAANPEPPVSANTLLKTKRSRPTS